MAIFDYPFKRYQTYDRRTVAAALEPSYRFRASVGTWGISGIIRYGDGSNYVLFVSFGQKQGEHEFDEAVYENGIVRWQSQPSQAFSDRVIQNLISHNHLTNDVLLFLRTSKRDRPYTFMGFLKYVNHDSERERPVHFHWEILDFDSTRDYEALMGLRLQTSPDVPQANHTVPAPAVEAIAPRLIEQRAPERTGRGTRLPTREFRGAVVDYEERDRRNRGLGRAGELMVLAHERHGLSAHGRQDLAAKVEHVSVTIGDGLGYDIRTFDPATDEEIHVEVKTTAGPAETPFYMSASEVAYVQGCRAKYRLVRIYQFRSDYTPVPFFVIDSPFADQGRLDLSPFSYRVRIK